MFMLLADQAAFGQPAANPAAPTIEILAAPTGALLRSQGVNRASLDLGRVSYFKGTSAPGQSSRKNSRSFVISTWFALKVDCPGNAASSKVNLTMTRLDAAASHAITIDGIMVGLTERILAPSMPCGSGSNHRMDVEVPVSTPAGSIGSSIVFLATLNK
jgi:hypothetical protein